jgi:hypothetical protein
VSTEPWLPYSPCPCGCGVVGWKLVRPLKDDLGPAHVVGCSCRRHTNKRNVRKGKAAQARTHTELIGSGFTPYHEESGRFADITVRPEVKAGKQVPKAFHAFLATDWFRRALSQSERAIPEGVDARPAVSIDGRWLVVDIRPKKRAGLSEEG